MCIHNSGVTLTTHWHTSKAASRTYGRLDTPRIGLVGQPHKMYRGLRVPLLKTRRFTVRIPRGVHQQRRRRAYNVLRFAGSSFKEPALYGAHTASVTVPIGNIVPLKLVVID